MKNIILSIALFCSVIGANASVPENNTKPNNKYTNALFYRALYLLKIKIYNQAEKKLFETIKTDSTFIPAWIALNNLYVIQNRYDKVEQISQKIIDLDGGSGNALFFYGYILYSKGEYEKSSKYITQINFKRDSSAQFKKNVAYMKQCLDFALNSVAKPLDNVPSKINKLGTIEYSEITPFLETDKKTIVFSKKVKVEANSEIKEEDQLFSTFKEDNTEDWTRPRKVDIKFDGESGNITAPFLTKNDSTMFFSASDIKGCKGQADIFMSTKIGKSWSTPENLGSNINSKYFETQACLSPDGKTIFFSSNRPGGIGKFDIWYSEKNKKGKWEEAKNIGAPINSENNEYSPLIASEDSVLFFSSNGHIGMGGLDLYYSKRNPDGTWGSSINLGYPINAGGQQFGITIAPDGKTIYYSSDKTNLNSDIYMTTLPKQFQVPKMVYIKGKVIDLKKNTVVKNTEILALDSSKSEIAKSTIDTNGLFSLRVPVNNSYIVKISNDDYLPYLSTPITLDENFAKTSKEYKLDIPLMATVKKVTYNFEFFNNITKEKIPAKYLVYKKGNDTLLYELSASNDGTSEIKLEKDNEFILKTNLNKYENISLTLNQNSPTQQISLNPIEKYKLIKFKIENSETKSNVSDVKIKIDDIDNLKTIANDNIGLYKLNTNNEFNAIITKQGYFDYFVKLKLQDLQKDTILLQVSLSPRTEEDLGLSSKNELYEKEIEFNQDVLANIPVNNIQKTKFEEAQKDSAKNNTTEVAPLVERESKELHCMFKISSYQISEEAKKDLKEVVTAYKSNKKIKISIEGYSNKGGRKEYNLLLSERRAKAIYNYLVGKGIKKSNLNVKWFGDTVNKYEDNEKNKCAIVIF